MTSKEALALHEALVEATKLVLECIDQMLEVASERERLRRFRRDLEAFLQGVEAAGKDHFRANGGASGAGRANGDPGT